MTHRVSIEHAQSTAMVGKDIVLWGAGRSIELAFRSTEIALSIASRGLGKVIEQGQQAAAVVSQGGGKLFMDRADIAQKHSREEYERQIETTKAILKESDNPELIAAIHEQNGRHAISYAQFLIKNDLTTDLDTGRTLSEHVITSGAETDTIMHIEENLKVEVPLSETIAGEQGIAEFMAERAQSGFSSITLR